MPLYMHTKKLDACIKIAACICGKDGIISQLEEQAIFKIVIEQFPDFGKDNIELALSEFFDSNQQIEDYLALIDDEVLQKFTLGLAEASASADGMALVENIALQKAYLIWGIKNHA